MTPEDITRLLLIAKYSLQDEDLFDKISFELDIHETVLAELRDKLIEHLKN